LVVVEAVVVAVVLVLGLVLALEAAVVVVADLALALGWMVVMVHYWVAVVVEVVKVVEVNIAPLELEVLAETQVLLVLGAP
jgi:uncharacterized membrane protein